MIAINAGSSSLKFQLYEMPEEKVLAKGLLERIGFSKSEATIEAGDKEVNIKQDMETHAEGVEL